ncbi:Uncharacterised protein [uncultured archaeon]|nr:Uncharacterised protein [uncultured archaeon]
MKKMVIIILFMITLTSSSHPEEAVGSVTRIMDGTTFEVSDLGCVRLADVVSDNANTLFGVKAREFTRDNLMGTQVFLDIDNKTGQDKSGCWLCVVYKANANGTANQKKNFNKMFVDAGYGFIRDDPATEFDPAKW